MNEPRDASPGSGPAGAAGGLSGRGSSTQPDPAALAEAIAELQGVGTMEPPLRERLIKDLQRTNPVFWPQLLQSFGSSVAYSRHQSKQAAEAAPQRPQAGAAPPGPASFEASRALPSMIGDRDDVPFELFCGNGRDERAAANHDLAAAGRPLAGPDGGSGVARIDAPLQPIGGAGAFTPDASQVRLANFQRPESVGGAPSGSLGQAKDDWRGHLAAAIRCLQRDRVSPQSADDEADRKAAAQLLRLVEEGSARAPGAEPARRDTREDQLAKQLSAVASQLAGDGGGESDGRMRQASAHVRDAAARLAELAPLAVRHLAFCTEVSSYGVYKKFAEDRFEPGQEVLLYAEVENFTSKPTDKGFHSALASSYQVFDERGVQLTEEHFALTEENCQNPRRDFFLRYFVWMPKHIPSGKYTLKLTIEDVQSHKAGQASIEFAIRQK